MRSKIVYNIVDASLATAFENPVRAGNYLLPANSTEIAPPEFDASTHTCSFNGTQWVVIEIPEPEPEPTPEPIPAMEQLRIQRNQLLASTDWRMNTDYPYSDQAAWASYRTQLRDLPESAEPTLDESGKLIVDWPTPPDQI